MNTTYGEWLAKYGSEPRGFKTLKCRFGMHTFYSGSEHALGKVICVQCGKHFPQFDYNTSQANTTLELEYMKVKTSEGYIENGGNCCPVCDSEDITAQPVEIDGLKGYSHVTCETCESTWTDVLDLICYEDLEVSDKARATLDKGDWRDSQGYYPSNKSCVVCGSTDKIGAEPRFGYSICEKHSHLPPTELQGATLDKENR